MDDDTADAGRDRGPSLDARRRLADSIRRLISASVLTTADDDALHRAIAAVTAATETLAQSVRTSRYEGIGGLASGSPDNELLWESHAAFGRSNPLAPPVTVEEQPGHLHGSVTFGGAWEGGPGTVYGGFVAAAFDGMLGRAALSAGHLGVTRSLTIRFRRPTPLGAALHIESRAGEVTGRDMAVSAQLSSDGLAVAEADALFAAVDPSRYRR
jgi:acyl-coenzyme A thioesterase PaaI-like protein